jgi:2-keto-4-pentenoate hydratase/2-oxohepta-3-ene-1,7-dioic acid hydratase in catechol pathway
MATSENDGRYRLVSYKAQTGPSAGIVLQDEILNVAELTGDPRFQTVIGILSDWDSAKPAIETALRGAGSRRGLPLRGADLLAPVLYPGTIFCAGANYTDHMLEMAAVHKIEPEPDPRSLGLKPFHFIKASRAAVGPDSIVHLPAYSKKVDWEGELAAVIGRTAKNIPVESALEHVAGYTVANDLSARDFTTRPGARVGSPFQYDWLSQKSFDFSCPLGPWIVPASDVPDPQNLGIKLWVNDVIKQDSHTSRMIFSLADQIAHISTRITLHPGDVILTGTPAGVGLARNEFLHAGDVVRVWVEGIGTLSSQIA